MYSPTRNQKKRRIALLVERAINQGISEDDSLKSIRSFEFPPSLGYTLPVFLFIIGAQLLLLTGCLYYALSRSWIMCYIFSIVVITVGIAGLWFARFFQEKRNQVVQALLEAVTELYLEETALDEYLTNVDKKTAKFFHCVTTSKVTAYYILGQLKHELHTLNNLVGSAIEKKKLPELEQALLLLQGSVTVSNGLVAEAGQEHTIPIISISATINELRNTLEKGLQELKEEIDQYRARMRPQD